jgi:hypothetical protein
MKAIRLAGATLIEEDQIPLVPEICEALRKKCGKIRGTLPRSADQRHDGIPCRCWSARWHNDDAQIDLSARGRGARFRNPHGSTADALVEAFEGTFTEPCRPHAR